MFSNETSSRTRAELKKMNDAIEEERAKKTSTKTKEEFKRRQDIFKGMLKQCSEVDVVFLVDCTGSMVSRIAHFSFGRVLGV